jgi:hypothetical protein
MAESRIASLLVELRGDRNPATLEAVAGALAEKSALRPYPLKAAVATLRYHRQLAEFDAQTEKMILERTRALLVARPLAKATPEDPEFCGEERAAGLLGVGVDELRQLMIDPVQRRLAGYPYWDGRQWRYPLAALRGATRHSFLAALPVSEPCEDLLPPWCRRHAPMTGEGPKA